MSSAYVSQYTEISSVRALTGETIDDDSDPTNEQVMQWIREVEQNMVSKGYDTQTFTSITIDVPEGDPDYPLDLLQRGLIYSDNVVRTGLVLALPHEPIVSVANVQRNIAGYTEDPSWEDLTEGPGSGTHFLIVKGEFKTGLKGTALYFYRNAPKTGYQRLKLDYTWGYELPEDILREYATIVVSLKFLYAKYLRKEPVFDVNVAGIRTDLNPFTEVHQAMYDRLEQIKEDYLPSEWVGVALKP
jgi:hypothetical protein